jgi:hypothetical protein
MKPTVPLVQEKLIRVICSCYDSKKSKASILISYHFSENTI